MAQADLAPLPQFAPSRPGQRSAGRRANADVPRLRIVDHPGRCVALAAILGGAVVFVDAVEGLARSVGLDETLLALVIAPIATELPEKFNSVIWIRRGKDTLALGNITGAMVFQSRDPDLDRARSSPRANGRSAAARGSPSRRPASPSSRRSLIFLPMIRTGRLLRPAAARSAASSTSPSWRWWWPASSGLVRRLTGRPPEAAGMMRPRTVAFRARGARTGAVPDADRQARRDPPGSAAVDLDSLICYFEGGYVPMRDAKISIMTHAFMYGTAVFEGIRAYWNADQGQLYGLFLREHVAADPRTRAGS